MYSSSDRSAWALISGGTLNFPTAAGTFNTYGPYSIADGTRYIRFYGEGANTPSQGADMNLDNVTWTGCGSPVPPTITGAFQVSPVAVNAVSRLVYTLHNPNSSAISGVQVNVDLPTGLEVAAAPNASLNGCGSPTFSPTAGAASLAFSGGTIAGSGDCTVGVDILAATPGPHTAITDFISATETGANTTETGSAKATLVALLPPEISMYFSPDSILEGGVSTLTYLITNPNPNDALPAVAFSHTLASTPAQLSVAATPAVTLSGCGSPTFAPTVGATSIAFSGATIAAGGSCMATVNLTAPSVGTYNTSTGTVSTTIDGQQRNGNSATGVLTVTAPNPSFKLTKQVSASSAGPWMSFLTATVGQNVYLRYTLENTGDVPLSTLSLTDDILNPGDCTLPSTLPVASASEDPSASCVVGPFAAEEGEHITLADGGGEYSAQPYVDSSSAGYLAAPAGLSLVAQLGPGPDGPWSNVLSGLTPGDDVYYRFILVNNSLSALDTLSISAPGLDMTGCVLLDPLAAGEATVCRVGPVSASATPADQLTDATGQGLVSGVTPVLSNQATVQYFLALPDLTVTVSNDVSGAALVGSPFNWTVTFSNAGTQAVTFTSGQKFLSANLPVGPTYGLTSVGSFTGVSPSGNVVCAINSNILACEANLASVTVNSGGGFAVSFSVTPDSTDPLNLSAGADPGSVVTESDETNNSDTDSVTVADMAVDLSVTLSSGETTVSPNQAITYTLTVANQGPADGSYAILRLPTATNISASGAMCSSALNGATCPTFTLNALQGAGVALDDFPAGGSLVFTVQATVTAASGSVTQTADVSAPDNVSETNTLNNAASETLVVSTMDENYQVYLPRIEYTLYAPSTTQWGVSLGYEDFPLNSGLNDYDYNDWVVDIQGANTYINPASNLLEAITFTIAPNARGGTYDHRFSLTLPANTFVSDGSATLTLFDQNHAVIGAQTSAFQAGKENTYVIFSQTSAVYPNWVTNSVETRGREQAKRTAELRITFNTPAAFELNPADLLDPHGASLFFKPTLLVLDTLESVAPGSLLVLSTPTYDWLWPEERVRLDLAYPLVGYVAGNPPTFQFPASWWNTYNTCAFDGRVCGSAAPASTP